MKSETSTAAAELEAPISLTPEELEPVAAGGDFFPPGTIFGVIIQPNPSPAPTPPPTPKA
jgi:hypothetical protein